MHGIRSKDRNVNGASAFDSEASPSFGGPMNRLPLWIAAARAWVRRL
jgi:hypothetical protein